MTTRRSIGARARLAGLLAAVSVAILSAACVSSAPAVDPLTSKSVKEVRGEPIDRALRTATVRVRNTGCGTLATGSGVVLGPDLIATNRHVVDGASKLEINTWDGRTLQVDVASVAQDTDLALVRVNGSLPAAISFAADDLASGDKVTIAGYPEGHRLALVTGTVQGEGQGPFGEVEGVVYVDATVKPGNSGGPVANSKGELTGLVYAGWVDGGLAAVIPASRLRRLHDDGGFTAVDPCANKQSPADAAIAAGYGVATLPPPPSAALPSTTVLQPCPSERPSVDVVSYREGTINGSPAIAETAVQYRLSNPTSLAVQINQFRFTVYFINGEGMPEYVPGRRLEAGDTVTLEEVVQGGPGGRKVMDAAVEMDWSWADPAYAGRCPTK